MVVDLQTPRAAEELTREFAIKGGLKLTLDEVMSAVRIIKDRPRKYVMGTANVAAAVGFHTEFALTNTFAPDFGQDGTIHVHKMWCSSAVATNVNLTWPTTAVLGLTVIPTMRFIDNRRAGVPLASFGQDNTAVATAADTFMSLDFALGPAFEVTFDPHPIIIAPVVPFSLLIRPGSVNQDMRLGLLWSEPPDPP